MQRHGGLLGSGPGRAQPGCRRGMPGGQPWGALVMVLLLSLGPAEVGAVEAADTWAPFPISGEPRPRSRHTAVWTGTELIIWGGEGLCVGPAAFCGDGARFNPATSIWTPLPSQGAPSPRTRHAAVWTGREMLVWGGSALDLNTGSLQPVYLGDGAAYDPATDAWRPLPTAGAPAGRADHTAIWTGRELLIWGGQVAGSTPAEGAAAADGARYDPTTNTWASLPSGGAPRARKDHTAVWTGREMLVWGGEALDARGQVPLGDGGRFDPATNTWTPLPTQGAPSPRFRHTTVWTGHEMLVWGGWGQQAADTSGNPGDGARYDPATNTWAPLPTRGAPSARAWHTTVWTGSELLVWGGVQALGTRASVSLADGARYSRAMDRWSPMTTTNAPRARFQHTAVWTGAEMLVWGGTGGTGVFPFSLGEGARYAPAALPPAAPAHAPPLPHDARYFPATRYRVEDDDLWQYFQLHGGIETFGYPVSRTFAFLGCPVQAFQRLVLQLCPGQAPALLNLLDPELLPYTRINGSTFPAPDQQLKAATPRVGDADYDRAMVDFVRATVPDSFEGQPVQFGRTFFDTGGLAVWGAPVSRPQREPSNPDFVYQRFQRGIMHFDATTRGTRGILLADYLKSILRDADVPADLREQARGSRLFAQYCPGRPGWLCRPDQLPGTELIFAFEEG